MISQQVSFRNSCTTVIIANQIQLTSGVPGRVRDFSSIATMCFNTSLADLGELPGAALATDVPTTSSDFKFELSSGSFRRLPLVGKVLRGGRAGASPTPVDARAGI
jgi:hypothetical protein